MAAGCTTGTRGDGVGSSMPAGRHLSYPTAQPQPADSGGGQSALPRGDECRPSYLQVNFHPSVNGRNVSSVLRSTGIYNCGSPGSVHPSRPSTASLCRESHCPAALPCAGSRPVRITCGSAHTCRPPCPSIAHTPCTRPHFPASRPAPLSCPERTAHPRDAN